MADDRPDAEHDETHETPLRAPGESVLEVMQKSAGVKPRVLLRDAPGEESPVLRMHSRSSDEAAKDDSRYQVVGEIGRGGVGIIFKSRDRDLGRDVAMKVLRPEMAAKPHVVERFVEEAQVAGQLQHPGVVPVYGMGLQDDGRPFFTMKLVKGKTLAALLAARRSPDDDRRRFFGIFEQICQTMAYAHARGVVHRDLKPANVMVGAFGEVQLMDWGFAKVLGRKAEDSSEISEDSLFEVIDTVRSGSEGSQSIAGAVMGTPAYMPPEQAMGRIDALDERADVFALGSILCEILTGTPAYTGESTEQLVQAARGQLEDALTRIEEAPVAAELKSIVTACLAPAPAARPRDAGFVAREFTDHLASVQARAQEAELGAARAKAEAEAQRQALLEERAKAEREQAREAQRSREAAWAARSRKRALVLAALIIVGLLVGSGAWFGIEKGRVERARDATQRIHAALLDASQLRARGSWDGALEAVAMARQLAAQHVDDRDLTDRIERLGAQIVSARDESAAAAERKERNDAMVERLREIGGWVARQSEFAPRGDDPIGVERQYAEAFREFGLDVADAGDKLNVARIRESGIRDELTSALDDWVWVRRVGCEMEPAKWQPLLDVANLADNDPFRARLRAAIHATSGRELRRLADEADLSALAARTIAMLGRALIEANDFGAAMRLLREGRRLHPAHVGISHFLAYVLTARNPRVLAGRKPTKAELTEALRCRSSIAALRPDADESWMQLGNVLLFLERYEEGRDAFWRAVSLDPGNPVNHVGVGMSHTLGDTEAPLLARAYEREVRRLDVPPRLDAFELGLGLGHLQRFRFREAVPYLESALARGSVEDPMTTSMLAAAYLGMGRTEEALRSAYAAKAEGVNALPIVVIIARDQAYRLRDPHAAIETLDEALGPYGRGVFARMRALLLRETKQYQRALDLLEPRVRAGNEPPSALVEVGSLKAHLGDIEGAHAAWDAAADASRGIPNMYWTTLAITAWELAAHDVEKARDPGRALLQAELAHKKLPESWVVTMGLAAALRANGRLDEAQQAVDAFLKQRDDVGTWIDAGRVWAALDEPGLARRAFEEAVLRFPKNAIVLNAAAFAGVIGPENDPVLPVKRAVELARQAVALAGKSWAIRNTLAHALLRDGQYAEAAKQIEIAMSLRETLHASDAFVRGMAAWHLGDKDAARTWRDRGLLALIALNNMASVRETLAARDEALALIEDE
ncbi:MAG: protein kinase [Planctomycetota bacterium]|nr:protein kinase [Planctomycetota bacterium]